jgi:dethiobiotin synthetase
VKPVESGCGENPEGTEDGAILAVATGQPEPRHALLRLRTPVAPPVAADLEGVTIDVDALLDAIRSLASTSDVVLVEGAGGFCSPLSWNADLLDFAEALDASVLVVGSDRLGVVNHVILTINTLLSGSLSLLGVVLGAPAAADASTGRNADVLRRVLGGRESSAGYDRIATIARGDWREAADEIETVVSWVEEELAVLRSSMQERQR